mgnify:CR=1 FL=1
MTIRQATIADLEISYQIEIACFPESEAASKANVEKRLRQFPQGYLIAESVGKAVGHINSGATNKDDISDEALKALIGHEDDGKNLVIFSVAVLPDYQRQGIAAALLHEYIKRAKNSNHQAILLLCKENLVTYYAKFGFEDGGLSESTHGGAKWHEMKLIL